MDKLVIDWDSLGVAGDRLSSAVDKFTGGLPDSNTRDLGVNVIAEAYEKEREGLESNQSLTCENTHTLHEFLAKTAEEFKRQDDSLAGVAESISLESSRAAS